MEIFAIGLIVGLIAGIPLGRGFWRGADGRPAQPLVIFRHRATGREYRLEGQAIDGKAFDCPFPRIRPRYFLLLGPDGHTEVWKAELVDQQFDRLGRRLMFS